MAEASSILEITNGSHRTKIIAKDGNFNISMGSTNYSHKNMEIDTILYCNTFTAKNLVVKDKIVFPPYFIQLIDSHKYVYRLYTDDIRNDVSGATFVSVNDDLYRLEYVFKDKDVILHKPYGLHITNTENIPIELVIEGNVNLVDDVGISNAYNINTPQVLIDSFMQDTSQNLRFYANMYNTTMHSKSDCIYSVTYAGRSYHIISKYIYTDINISNASGTIINDVPTTNSRVIKLLKSQYDAIDTPPPWIYKSMVSNTGQLYIFIQYTEGIENVYPYNIYGEIVWYTTLSSSSITGEYTITFINAV